MSNKLNPNQFKLFYGAQELQNAVTRSGDREYLADEEGNVYRDEEGNFARESLPQMWDRKLEESKKPEYTGHGSGVYDSMMSEGVRPHTSLTVHHPTPDNGLQLADGHHRLAAAADIERTTGKNMWIFTNHEDNLTKRNLRAWGNQVQADRYLKKMAGYQQPVDNATPSAHKRLTNDIVHRVL